MHEVDDKTQKRTEEKSSRPQLLALFNLCKHIYICVWCVSNQKTKSKPRSYTATVFNRFVDYSLLNSHGHYWEN